MVGASGSVSRPTRPAAVRLSSLVTVRNVSGDTGRSGVGLILNLPSAALSLPGVPLQRSPHCRPFHWVSTIGLSAGRRTYRPRLSDAQWRRGPQRDSPARSFRQTNHASPNLLLLSEDFSRSGGRPRMPVPIASVSKSIDQRLRPGRAWPAPIHSIALSATLKLNLRIDRCPPNALLNISSPSLW
jgi:hypothetical protein